jgi:Folliculin-interacting protein middle domain
LLDTRADSADPQRSENLPHLSPDVIGDVVFGTAPLRSGAGGKRGSGGRDTDTTKIHFVSETAEFCLSKVFDVAIAPEELQQHSPRRRQGTVGSDSAGSSSESSAPGTPTQPQPDRRRRASVSPAGSASPYASPLPGEQPRVRLSVGIAALFPLYLLDPHAPPGERPVGLCAAERDGCSGHHKRFVQTCLQKYVLHFFVSHFVVIDTRMRKVADLVRHFLVMWHASVQAAPSPGKQPRVPPRPPRFLFQKTPVFGVVQEFMQLVSDLFRTPRLSRPIWPHLLSFPEAQDTVLSHFFDELSKCFEILDSGNRYVFFFFFIIFFPVEPPLTRPFFCFCLF